MTRRVHSPAQGTLFPSREGPLSARERIRDDNLTPRRRRRSTGPLHAAERTIVARAPTPEALVQFTVPLALAGKARPKVYGTKGRKSGIDYPDSHKRFLAVCETLARAHWRGKPTLHEPVDIFVVGWFRRPKRLCKKSMWGDGPRLYQLKPDYDQSMGLAMDALKNVGVLKDDTLVCNHDRAPVQRWYLPLDEHGNQVGSARTVIRLQRHTPVDPYPWSL